MKIQLCDPDVRRSLEKLPKLLHVKKQSDDKDGAYNSRI